MRAARKEDAQKWLGPRHFGALTGLFDRSCGTACRAGYRLLAPLRLTRAPIPIPTQTA
jgi:hypothetical protein